MDWCVTIDRAGTGPCLNCPIFGRLRRGYPQGRADNASPDAGEDVVRGPKTGRQGQSRTSAPAHLLARHRRIPSGKIIREGHMKFRALPPAPFIGARLARLTGAAQRHEAFGVRRQKRPAVPAEARPAFVAAGGAPGGGGARRGAAAKKPGPKTNPARLLTGLGHSCRSRIRRDT